MSADLTDWQRYRLRRARKEDRDGGIRALECCTVDDAVLVGKGWLTRDGERLRITDAGREALRPEVNEETEGAAV